MKLMRQLLLILVAILSAAAPVLANDEQDCFQSQEPQLRIKGCSEMIQRAPNDASVYHNRAVAYGLAGDIDSAIADYTKVIEMAPDTVSAYENRGRAYANKGDYAHATADETKANELISNATAQSTVVTPKTLKARKTKALPLRKQGRSHRRPMQSRTPANNVGKEALGSSWWSWLWGDSADQTSGKKGKR